MRWTAELDWNLRCEIEVRPKGEKNKAQSNGFSLNYFLAENVDSTVFFYIFDFQTYAQHNKMMSRDRLSYRFEYKIILSNARAKWGNPTFVFPQQQVNVERESFEVPKIDLYSLFRLASWYRYDFYSFPIGNGRRATRLPRRSTCTFSFYFDQFAG